MCKKLKVGKMLGFWLIVLLLQADGRFVLHLGLHIQQTKPKNVYCLNNLINWYKDSIILVFCSFSVVVVVVVVVFCFFCFAFMGWGSVHERKWEIMQNISIPKATALDKIPTNQNVKKWHFLRKRAN